MGTPEFSAVSLQHLIDSGFDVAAVYTQPDKPKSRGMKLSMSPVKELALRHNIPVHQPESLKDTAEELAAYNPDIIAVVAYGRLLPADIISIPSLGCINIHGSLLPEYRGSAPVQWAVLNGDEITGVTSMYMDEHMDTGDMIYKSSTRIGEYETAGELFQRLSVLGGELLVKTLRAIDSGMAPRIPQEHIKASYTTQLSKEMCPIDWSKTPKEIVKKVCGLIPWPVATMTAGGVTLKVFEVSLTCNTTKLPPGSIVDVTADGIEVACAMGKTLLVKQVQAPGKKRMNAADYARGHSLGAGI